MNQIGFSDQKKVNKNDYISVIDIIRFLELRKKFIILVMFLFLAVGIYYCVHVKQIFRSSSTLVLPSENSDNWGNMLSGMGGLSLLYSGGISSKTRLYVELFTSRRMIQHLIDKFTLQKVFELKKEDDPLEYKKLLDRVKKMIVVETEKTRSLMYLHVDAFTPELSREMAYEVILNTNRMINEFNYEKASEKRLFLETRISEVNLEIDRMQQQMTKEHRDEYLYEFNAQSKNTIDVVSKLYAEIQDLKTKMLVQTKFVGDKDPEYVSNKMLLEEKKKFYDKFFTIENLSKVKKEISPLISMTMIPMLKIRYMELKREIDGQEELLKVLKQQYELAKIEEKKEDQVLKILDFPTLPVKKHYPSYSVILLLSVIAGFFMGIVLLLAFEMILLLRTTKNADVCME